MVNIYPCKSPVRIFVNVLGDTPCSPNGRERRRERDKRLTFSGTRVTVVMEIRVEGFIEGDKGTISEDEILDITEG